MRYYEEKEKGKSSIIVGKEVKLLLFLKKSKIKIKSWYTIWPNNKKNSNNVKSGYWLKKTNCDMYII